MTHLRTDLPLLPDQEMDDLPLLPDQEMDEWVDGILEKTHYRDIKALRQKLDEAIESNDSGMTHESMRKKCNKCDKTYSENVDKCECGNTNLETFKVHYNTD